MMVMCHYIDMMIRSSFRWDRGIFRQQTDGESLYRETKIKEYIELGIYLIDLRPTHTYPTI